MFPRLQHHARSEGTFPHESDGGAAAAADWSAGRRIDEVTNHQTVRRLPVPHQRHHVTGTMWPAHVTGTMWPAPCDRHHVTGTCDRHHVTGTMWPAPRSRVWDWSFMTRLQKLSLLVLFHFFLLFFCFYVCFQLQLFFLIWAEVPHWLLSRTRSQSECSPVLDVNVIMVLQIENRKLPQCFWAEHKQPQTVEWTTPLFFTC